MNIFKSIVTPAKSSRNFGCPISSVSRWNSLRRPCGHVVQARVQCFSKRRLRLAHSTPRWRDQATRHIQQGHRRGSQQRESSIDRSVTAESPLLGPPLNRRSARTGALFFEFPPENAKIADCLVERAGLETPRPFISRMPPRFHAHFLSPERNSRRQNEAETFSGSLSIVSTTAAVTRSPKSERQSNRFAS